MDLAHLQKPTLLGSALEALCKVEFPAAYAVTVTFEHLPTTDDTLILACHLGFFRCWRL